MTINTITLSVILSLLVFATPASAEGGQGQGQGRGKAQGATESNPALDLAEQEHLVFMREEEKLARDVYITLGARYPKLKVFGKIDDAEQRHTCAVCDKLKKYGIDDPNSNDNVGVYTGDNYGPYFTKKFAGLVERGSASALDALYVGAYIEELDMIDIRYCPEEIIEQVPVMEKNVDCGSLYTDKPDLRRLYDSLLAGSENHLRAFVRNIERSQGEGSYRAQVLPQEQVDMILGR